MFVTETKLNSILEERIRRYNESNTLINKKLHFDPIKQDIDAINKKIDDIYIRLELFESVKSDDIEGG